MGELAEPLFWICATQGPGVMGVCVSLPGNSIGRHPCPLRGWPAVVGFASLATLVAVGAVSMLCFGTSESLCCSLTSRGCPIPCPPK